MSVALETPCVDREVKGREFIDYTTSMITDEDLLQGLLIYQDLVFSHTLHVLKERSAVTVTLMVKSMRNEVLYEVNHCSSCGAKKRWQLRFRVLGFDVCCSGVGC